MSITYDPGITGESLVEENLVMASGSDSMTTSIEGMDHLPPATFVNLPEAYICVKCKKVLSSPVQTPCGHLVCRQCGEELKRDGPTRCPAGESDCEDIDKDTALNPDKCAIREMKKLPVFCPFKESGCVSTLPWKKLTEHLKKCQYAPVKCSNRGCSEQVTLKDLEKHAKDLCGYRSISCSLCHETLYYKDKDEHDKRDCPNAEEPCPYKCGEQCIQRKDLETHTQICRYRPTSCKYASFLGCAFQGSDQDVRHHENTSTEYHLELCTFALTKLQTDNLRLENRLSEKLQNEDRMKKSISELQKKMNDTEKLLVQHSAQQQAATSLISSLQEDNQKHTTDMTLMRKQLEKLTSRVQRSESETSERITQIEQRGGADINPNITSRLMTFEHLLTSHTTAFNEYNIRMQCLETASFNGRLTWKISDYSRRKRDAVSGRTLSLYSQPFYSHRNGYKMCLRVYINGDGIGKGTYMSLFFVIMKGEYDNLMRWPFQQRVILKLICLDPDGGQNVVDSFVPDVTSSSFQKPRTEMNVASGCPMFVKQHDLESLKYLRDDSIFITVEVDTDGCFVQAL